MEQEEIVRKELTPFAILQEQQVAQTQELNDITREDLVQDVTEKKVITPPIQGQDEPPATPTEVVTKDELPETPKQVVEEEEDELEYDVKITGNLAKYSAEALKASGALPDDFEITDDITESQINEAYFKFKEETFRNQVRQEELERLQNEEGITPQMLEEMKLRYYGVQDENLVKLQGLQFLSNYQFDDKLDTYEDTVRSFLNDYYTLKSYPRERISRMVETDLLDEDLEGVIKTYQQDLGNQAAGLSQQIQHTAQEQERKLAEQRQQAQQKRDELLQSGLINGVQYTKEEMEAVSAALKVKSEIITDEQGRKFRVTPYYKKKLEASQNLEKRLEDQIRFILGSDPQKVKNREAEKAQAKVLNQLNKFVQVEVKTPKNTKQTPSPRQQAPSEIQRTAIN